MSNNKTYYELTHPQKRIWHTELVNSGLEMSNIGYLITLNGLYDKELLKKAIHHVIKNNDGLRLRFKYKDNTMTSLEQYVGDNFDENISIIKTESREELEAEIKKIHSIKFDIINSQLCYFIIFEIGEKITGFYEKAHHLIADGISAKIVANEIIETYHLLELKTSDFQMKNNSYYDFAVHEKEYLSSEKFIRDKEHWLERFTNFDNSVSIISSKANKLDLKVKRKYYSLPEKTFCRIETFNRINGSNGLFVLLMSALNLYFYRVYSEDDIVIGMPVHNRSKRTFKDLVGMFVSTLPFRVQINEKWNFFDLLKYVKRSMWEDLKHQNYPFNILVKDLEKKSKNVLDLLNFQLIELPNVNNENINNIKFYSSGHNQSEVSVYISQKDKKELKSTELVFEYQINLLEDNEIDSFFTQLMFTLDQALIYPSMSIPDLVLVTFEEKSRLLYKFNDTKCDYPKEKTIHQLFDEQVEKNPTRIALECDSIKVSYEELGLKVNSIALKLIRNGVKPNTIVGLISERDENIVTLILGILKAGGVFLPIDPQYPRNRIAFMIDDSNLKYLLVQNELYKNRSDLFSSSNHSKVIDIDDITSVDNNDRMNTTTISECISRDLAYIIYTSGTTGNPKGVLIEHKGVVNYLIWAEKQYIRGDKVKLPLYTSLSFDLTITSLFLPLITGNTIIVYKDDNSNLTIQNVIEDNSVDLIKLTPSHLKVISNYDLSKSLIKRMILGGEELETSLAKNIYSSFAEDIEIFNEYGPTETVVGCMIHKFDPKYNIQRTVSIGKPSDNVCIYVLDKSNKLLPIGAIGEICISGDGVTRGYINRQSLTYIKYINVLIDLEKMIYKKIYRSGDLGRWNSYGELEYLGRIDSQVKIKGFRIELGEIEKQILINFQEIKEVVVTDREDESGQKYLCGYVVEKQGLGTRDKGLEIQEIKSSLSQSLPEYMIPSYLVIIDEIPLTPNGKIDRKALPAPKIVTGIDFIKPRNDMEELLLGIWKDILDLEKISITDNFYELGGDSIKAVQISARLHNIDLTLHVKEILTHHTIEQICMNVDLKRNIRNYEQDIVVGKKGLTPIKSWFFEQEFKNTNYYNQSVLLDLNKEIDISILETTFEHIVRHHDGLRLNYQDEDRTFFINNEHLKSSFKVQVADLSHYPEEDKLIQLKQVGVDLKKGFSIHEDLLLKALVVKYSKSSYKLLITAHHFVVDGISWRIILEDIFNVYNELSNKNKVDLPKKTASVIDWYNGLQKYSNSKEFENEISYWDKVLEHNFLLPIDTIDDTIVSSSVLSEEIILDSEKTEYLHKEAHKNFNTNIETLLIVAVTKALYSWTDEKSFVIEMENHGRQLENIDISRTTGWFTTMYPLRIELDKDDLTNQIKSIKEQMKSVPNNGLGYGIYRYILNKVDRKKKPQVRFNYLGKFDNELNNELFSYSNMDNGSEFSEENNLTAFLEINSMIINKNLRINISFDGSLITIESITFFKEEILNELNNLIIFLRNDDDVHFTPSDFDAADLDEDDLEVLFG